MKKINYDKICEIYDEIRQEDIKLINLFIEETNINKDSNILDIGCGTGNYTNTLEKLTSANIYEIDSSEGMLNKANKKDSNVYYKLSNAMSIPFPVSSFDFIYMTAVIHYIEDIDKMFENITRVLKSQGKLCVVSQSHKQIENRFLTKYFPKTAIVDKKRYPTIESIINIGKENNLNYLKSYTAFENEKLNIDDKFIELVEKKGFSRFHLISDEEYEKGLEKLKMDYKNKNIKAIFSGETLIWFSK